MRVETGPDLKGDERLFLPSQLAPGAFAVLEALFWEVVKVSEPGGAEFIAAKLRPTLPQSQWRDGRLEAAAVEAAACVQAELASRPQPFDRGDALLLDLARGRYLLALYELGGGDWKLAKDTESRVAGGQALAICLGAWGGTDARDTDGIGSQTVVHGVDRWGRPVSQRLGGYGGCLHTFPDAPYGRGRKWPRWCDGCKMGKTNAKNKAVAELKIRLSAGS